MAERKSRLGTASAVLMARRGADALATLAAAPEPGVSELANAVSLDITRIAPSPHQPRKTLDQEALRELADSIREKGILQPIVVRREGDRFTIVAGERRYRAALLVGLAEMPAIIREASGDEAIEQSLIENLQRENIDPVEEASSFHELMRLHGYSIRDLAARVHKSHAYVAERLQLIKYPEVAEAVAAGQVSAKAASELARVDNAALRRELLGRVRSGELDSRHIRRAKRGEPPLSGPASAALAGSPATVEQSPPSLTERHPQPVFGTGRETAAPPASAPITSPRAGERQPFDLDITREDAGNAPGDRTAAADPVAAPRGAAPQPGISPPAFDAIEAASRALAALDLASVTTDRESLRLRLRALADQIAAFLERLG